MGREPSERPGPAPGSDGVDFTPWPTAVRDEPLALVNVSFRGGVTRPRTVDGYAASVASAGSPEALALHASFASLDGERLVCFVFRRVVAFRVLDENGLPELWDASAVAPRPARTTFRVRDHGWTRESFLVFAIGGPDRFSHVVATDDLCLEVVCDEEPTVTIIGPSVEPDISLRGTRDA